MGKYTRELDIAPSIDGNSITVVSEEDTNKTYKTTINQFASSLETSVFTNTGETLSLEDCTVVSGVATFSTLDVDNLSPGDIIRLQTTSENLILVKKTGIGTFDVIPNDITRVSKFYYIKGYITTIDSDGNVGIAINYSDNKSFITVAKGSISATTSDETADFYSNATTLSLSATTSGTKVTLNSDGVLEVPGNSYVLGEVVGFGLGETYEVVPFNKIIDTQGEWDNTTRMFVPKYKGVFVVSATLNGSGLGIKERETIYTKIKWKDNGVSYEIQYRDTFLTEIPVPYFASQTITHSIRLSDPNVDIITIMMHSEEGQPTNYDTSGIITIARVR